MSVIYVNVLKGAEAFVSLKLIDFSTVVDIKLISAENGYCRAFFEAKDNRIFFDIHLYPVAVKRNFCRRTKRNLFYRGNNLLDLGVILVHRGSVIRGKVKRVYVIALRVIPIEQEAMWEFAIYSFKLFCRKVSYLLAAFFTLNRITVAFQIGKATVRAGVKCSLDVFSTLFM